jgi:hypothetical protein
MSHFGPSIPRSVHAYQVACAPSERGGKEASIIHRSAYVVDVLGNHSNSNNSIWLSIEHDL